MGNFVLFSAEVWEWVGEWVGGWVSLPKYCYFSPLKNNCISVVSHISYELECVVNFHNVHCRTLLRIPTWMSLYLIHLGQGLCWCRTINATNNPNNNNNKYKSVLNVKNERYIVVKEVYRCQLYTCKQNTLTVDNGKHLHKSLLILHKLRKPTLPSS